MITSQLSDGVFTLKDQANKKVAVVTVIVRQGTGSAPRTAIEYWDVVVSSTAGGGNDPNYAVFQPPVTGGDRVYTWHREADLSVGWDTGHPPVGANLGATAATRFDRYIHSNVLVATLVAGT